jgi:transcriptional regulator with XRE-family HTH domain
MQAALGGASQSALADRLGCTPQQISNWLRDGSVPAKWILAAARLSGRTAEWIGTGSEPCDKPSLVREAEAAYAVAPDVTRTLLAAIEDLGPAERETLARCAEALRAGQPDVRQHLIGQLKLIEDTVRLRAKTRGDPSARKRAGEAS